MSGVYIAGPMRGIDGFNFAAFEKAQRLVEAGRDVVDPEGRGLTIFNPAWADITRHGLEDLTIRGGWLAAGRHLEDVPDFDLRRALAEDTAFICKEASHIVLLPGWEKSSGARAEKALSEALGHVVWYVTPDMGAIVAQDPQNATPETIEDFILRDFKEQVSSTIEMISGRAYETSPSGEVMSVSASGAMKGTKPEAHHLIPREGLDEVARHYGKTAKKYPPHNWRSGFEWSKSYDALIRHATQWWSGEDNDPELDSPHLAAVAWHALTLLTFAQTHPEFDDRYGTRQDGEEDQAEVNRRFGTEGGER